MSKFRIRGKIAFQNLESGFWSIIGDDGREWRPVNFPEQLKHSGKAVEIIGREVDEESIFMWGTPIKIISFHTLTP
jgi:hypothetical protein